MKLGVEHLEDLARGAVFLATGGGGDPYVAMLTAQVALDKHGPIDLVPAEDIDDDATVVTIGNVGAPSAGLELLMSIDEPGQAIVAYQELLGRRIDAVASFEIGGGNSLVPLIAAASLGLPVIDGDGMGRALPEAQMMTYAIAGVSASPALVLDYKGDSVVLKADDVFDYERQVRQVSAERGGMVTAVEHPMTGRQLKDSVVPGTVSFSIELGRVLRENRGRSAHAMAPLSALFTNSIYGDVVALYSGKIVDHATSIVGGYDVGKVTVESFDGSRPPLVLDVKNEFLVARIGDEVIASVPDLITIVDDETTEPINAERLRYGQRVSVIAVGCPPMLRTPEALAVVEPRAFGFDFDFTPLGSRSTS